MTDGPILEVTGLEKHYPIRKGLLNREVGRIRAVDGVDFSIDHGETFGLVGESGCGKSTTAAMVLGLEEPTGGTVRFDGRALDDLTGRERQRFRRRTGAVFQDPDSSFDPRMTVGESVAEPLVVNGLADRERRRARVEGVLERVGLRASDADRYPHEFSGGQKQRLALARALVTDPDLLIADEPVSSLDVSVQADILSLLRTLTERFGLSVLFISHNLGVVRSLCDSIGVMYLGELVECGPAERLFADLCHPYTRALVSSIPVPDPTQRDSGRVRLTGDLPSPANPPPGCRFHTRCPDVIQPEAVDLEGRHWRRLVDVLHRLRTREVDPEAIRDAVIVNDPTVSDPAAVDREAFTTRLRAEFDLPPSLADAHADRALEHTASALYDGDLDGAADHLATALESVCLCERPTLEHRDGRTGHRVACHLLEDADRASPAGGAPAESEPRPRR
ncbi:ABC transporter ATP-binding protein [Natronobiforma cellulositropha]|uniref:ABC transporter ATP-binding protein n=1 Tax=Natronobiforma cellulositropha TaxID=1679076 RepID=UPI0021D5B792|nr:ABC transporter ATP-binding protein [Natronobiforma cellulositropha]